MYHQLKSLIHVTKYTITVTKKVLIATIVCVFWFGVRSVMFLWRPLSGGEKFTGIVHARILWTIYICPVTFIYFASSDLTSGHLLV